jgi:hypothetical protein
MRQNMCDASYLLVLVPAPIMVTQLLRPYIHIGLLLTGLLVVEVSRMSNRGLSWNNGEAGMGSSKLFSPGIVFQIPL